MKNWKYLNYTLIQYMHLFIYNYPLQYDNSLVTYLESKQQHRRSFEQMIVLFKFTATHWLLLVPISWYQRIEQKEITKSYKGYMKFDITFVSWVKVLLDLLKLRNFLPLHSVFPKTKIICFWFQTMKNDWVWRKYFERYLTIQSFLVDIVVHLFILNYTLEYANRLVT